MNGCIGKEMSLTEQVINNIDEKYVRMTLEYLEKPACDDRGTADCTEGIRKREKKGRYDWKRMLCKAAACILLVCAASLTALTTATAAGSLTAYQILYSLYPEVAIRLTPVNATCEDNGILMQVEAVDVNGSRADIYISLQDIAGDRVDETLDLFDSYSIQTTCDQSGICSLVSYDEKSKTATFLITVNQIGGKEIAGEKMTFSVSELLYGKRNITTELTEIALRDVKEADLLQMDVSVRGRGGRLSEYSEEMKNKFLVPDEQFRFSPTGGAWITGYALVDDVLHIQAYYEDILHYDNHGFIYLKDAEGHIQNCLCNIAFWDEEQSGSYEEYIFDLGLGDSLSDYTVWGDFTTCRTAVKGNWKVSFVIPRQSDSEAE